MDEVTVASRTRGKGEKKLVFKPPQQQIQGDLPFTLDDLSSLEMTWDEQARLLVFRGSAAGKGLRGMLIKIFERKLTLELMLEQDMPAAQRSSLREDRVLKDRNRTPIIAVDCTFDVGVELQLRALILTDRQRDRQQRLKRQGSGLLNAEQQRGTDSSAQSHKVPRQRHEQVLPRHPSAFPFDDLSSSGGGDSAAEVRPIEGPSFEPGTASPSPFYLGMSTMSLPMAFPGLSGPPAAAGDRLLLDMPLPISVMFDSPPADLAADLEEQTAGGVATFPESGGGYDNLFWLSEPMLAMESWSCSSDATTTTTTTPIV